MSNVYQTVNSNLSNYEIPQGVSNERGLTSRDIDGQVSYQEGEVNFYDYDVLSKPTVSGVGNIVQPANTSSGIPDIDDLNLGDSSTSLGGMIDTVNNGRVSDITVTNENFLDKGEADFIINKDNQQTAIKGIVENTALSDIYFSDMNLDAVQKTIRYNVYNTTDKVVSEQSKNELYVVMRSILLQYANFRVSDDNLINEIRDLNKRVVEYCSENVISNVQQYLGYIKDIEKLPTPMDHPAYHGKQNRTYDISNLL
jgi:hypothetical protein